MPRVITRKKSSGGKEIKCGKCGKDIQPGMYYKSWSFRYGGTRFRCNEATCLPRPSDLTMSEMSRVYAALESLQDNVHTEEFEPDDVRGWLDEAIGEIQEVADQYEEAAEHFGGAGENQERSESCQNLIGEIEDVEADKEDEESQSDYEQRIKDEIDSLESEM